MYLFGGFIFSFEHECEATLSAVMAIKVRCHEDTSTTFWRWALTTESVDLSIILNLIIIITF